MSESIRNFKYWNVENGIPSSYLKIVSYWTSTHVTKQNSCVVIMTITCSETMSSKFRELLGNNI
jgi:hypothetical protein